VLAGGEGERVRPLVERWLHQHKPKQFCTFVGTRSMLEHTLDRADRLGSPERHRVVITRAHLEYAEPQLSRLPRSSVVLQPANRDTAAGIFLPLAKIRALDPDATVVIYPSDHFVHPEERFLKAVEAAVRAAETTDRLVLLGVAPESPEREYGWIRPGTRLGSSLGWGVRTISTFTEKPAPDEARAVFEAGGIWNTLVLAVRAEVLWELGRRELPGLVGAFELWSAVVGTPFEESALDHLYRTIPRHNFSSELLARSVDRTAVIELDRVLWSDWGRPERIAETLRRIGRRPAFPAECLDAGLPAVAGVPPSGREAFLGVHEEIA
jgi:mannose-1-phosphate guanylyltransferase